MKKTLWTALAALGLVAGCSSAPPAGTPAQAPTRQLLDVGTMPDRETAVANFKNLPDKLDPATAAKVLVTIDPSQVETPAQRSLQWIGGLGWGWPYRSYLYGAYSYYPYGSYYYPYSYAGGYYRPYGLYGGYNPFFYRRFGLYRPYFW